MKTIRNYFKSLKANMILVSFLLLASCMQQDESLASDNVKSDELTDRSAAAQVTNGVSVNAKRIYTAHLLGANEVPPVDSNGEGQVIFTLDESGTQLRFQVIAANIKNVTQAHIHCGEAGVNGPVVVFLFGFDAEGVDPNGLLADGTITEANIIARDSTAICMGGLATFENLLSHIRNGSAYVNAHTLNHPGGEIRGQIR
jgi:hypothetical protein